MEIKPVWPSIFSDEETAQPFLDMQGATIVRIGMPVMDDRPEGGGLAIEFIPRGETEARTVVLGFNECGMWDETDFTHLDDYDDE